MKKPLKQSVTSNPDNDPSKLKRSSRPPEPGDVINYSYLWEHEYQKGRDEGAKDRPVAVVIVTRQVDGIDQVVVTPITTHPPSDDQPSIEVPIAVRRQLGLNAERSWVIVSEVNRFAWPGYDIRPIRGREPETRFGALPAGLFRQVRDAIGRTALGRAIDRDA